MKKIQEQNQETVQRIKTERDAKIQECEEIRMQVISSYFNKKERKKRNNK